MANTAQTITDDEALQVLKDFIGSWTRINERFSQAINTHSMCVGEKQIKALKICAERLEESL